MTSAELLNIKPDDALLLFPTVCMSYVATKVWTLRAGLQRGSPPLRRVRQLGQRDSRQRRKMTPPQDQQRDRSFVWRTLRDHSSVQQKCCGRGSILGALFTFYITAYTTAYVVCKTIDYFAE